MKITAILCFVLAFLFVASYEYMDSWGDSNQKFREAYDELAIFKRERDDAIG